MGRILTLLLMILGGMSMVTFALINHNSSKQQDFYQGACAVMGQVIPVHHVLLSKSDLGYIKIENEEHTQNMLVPSGACVFSKEL